MANSTTFVRLLAAAALAIGFAVMSGAAALPGDSGAAAAPALETTLTSLPRRVFKAVDPGKQRTESAYLYLVLETPTKGTWVTESLNVVVFAGDAVLSRETYEGPGLAGMRIDRPIVETDKVHRPLLVRLRVTAPASAAMDRAECTLSGVDPAGKPYALRVSVAIGTYQQKTKLIFPFRGHGLVTQGGIHDGGHSNRSGQFAVDAIGVTDMYCPQIADGDTNEAAAGWGREIIAPAAGVVVVVRSDRPDQPLAGTSNPEFFLPEFKSGGDPGNHVVIDHENGEFSMLAHFQAGSLLVREGQRIAQGEVIGRLGNAGDTNFPHVHYQLMDGKDWMASDALPYRFENVPPVLVRGTWFTAKP